MFLILAYFCYVFYGRARGKGHTEANRRAFVYAASGLAILASMLTYGNRLSFPWSSVCDSSLSLLLRRDSLSGIRNILAHS